MRIILFSLLFSLVIPLTLFAAPAEVPKTGQTTSYAIGDDGDLQTGFAWPVPRFADNGDGTVTDNLTGLIWSQDASTPAVSTCVGGPRDWQGALDYVACLNNNAHLGYIDWILPNIIELKSFADIGHTNPALPVGHPFTNIQSNYWSSNTYAGSTGFARSVNMEQGYVRRDRKADTLDVWPVRETKTTSTIALPKTGQTSSYASGDDGALQRGANWPSPRFIDNYDGTVTDSLTGLVWLKNANCFSVQTWVAALASTNGLASASCSLNDDSVSGDWRLPNRFELESLVDTGRYQPLPVNHPFAGVQSSSYWSSNSFAGGSGTSAWHVDMTTGDANLNGKTSVSYNVWPVRNDSDGDGDGVGDTSDAFPTDPAASVDTDNDGYPDAWNSGKTSVDSTIGLTLDDFPSDASESTDSDGDGVGDNRDAFLNDATETTDTDSDGVGDNADECPLDAENDADNDGYCANSDNCPAITNADQRDADKDSVGDVCDFSDTDGDGLLDSLDPQPAIYNSPLDNDTAFVRQVYLDFLNREPDAEGLNHWVGQLDAGMFDRSELVEQYLASAEFSETVSPVVRLYFTYYQRIPDYEGLMFWVNSFAAGMRLNDISDAFATAQEFIDKYGALTNQEFVSQMYINVYGRQPDTEGLAFWTNFLNAETLTRGQVMVEFSSAPEYLSISANQVYVTMTYMGLLRRAPDQEGFDYWASIMDQGASGLALIDSFLISNEYAYRFRDYISPVADAGQDQNVATGSLISLNGSGESPEGEQLTYAWAFTSKPLGSTATLSDPTVFNPQFTADLAGEYVLSLTVNDGIVDSAPDDLKITVRPPVEVSFGVHSGVVLDACLASGDFVFGSQIGSQTWYFSNCDIYGYPGNKIYINVRNNSANDILVKEAFIDYPMGFDVLNKIPADIQIVAPNSAISYETYLSEYRMVTGSIVTLSFEGLNDASANWDLNMNMY